MDPDDIMEVRKPKVIITKENRIATPSSDQTSKKTTSIVFEGGSRKSKNKDKDKQSSPNDNK
jgi:hypothetical protein